MDLKKLGKTLLFPRMWVMILLLPVAAVFLVGSMVFIGTSSPIAIASYVLSAYTLTVWCFKIPYLISFFKTFKNENKYILIWRRDDRLRVKVSLYGSLAFNTVYALFQLWLGFYHHTFWYYSLAGYYISLAVMRFFLVRHTQRFTPGERMREELIKYRACGWVFLIMNLALSLMIFFMVYWNRTFNHHEITAIAMAAYTFTSFTTAIVNMVRYRKYNSPVYSASKAISFAAACVSMLTLTSTMLTAFGDGTMDLSARRLMLALVGGAVSAVVMTMAVYMIAHSNKKLKSKEKIDGQ
ncbi:MAG: hypothetical protein IKJ04_08870 [Clostridia bacterium]|nr:hypothetical protein [Clostridia bacterium]